jgi:hypothetical protein
MFPFLTNRLSYTPTKYKLASYNYHDESYGRQSSWLQIQMPWYDSRRYQIF